MSCVLESFYVELAVVCCSVAVLQCVFSASFLVECSVQDIVRGLFRGAADLI